MGDSTNQKSISDRNDNAKEASTNSTLLGDILACGTIHDAAFRKHDSATCYLPDADALLQQISQNAKDQVCRMPTTEKYGPAEVKRDDTGELFEIKDRMGVTFTKRENGYWTMHESTAGIDFDSQVKNVTINQRGDISYDSADDPKVHYEKNVDGTHSATFDFGTYHYDASNRLIQAPAGSDGQTRKFHYDENGQLDQIDGRLGHWDRQTVDGKTSWKNKDTGAIWQGDFSLDSFSNDLEYRAGNGTSWNFTVRGEDKQMPDHAETGAQKFEKALRELEAQTSK